MKDHRMNNIKSHDVFGYSYLNLRHVKVFELIRHHYELACKELQRTLDNTSISSVQRMKISAYKSDLTEVMFVCENLHLYFKGIGKVISEDETYKTKVSEVKNQWEWITKYFPNLFDGVVMHQRFSDTFGKYLHFSDELQFNYFEIVTMSIYDISKPPFSFLKLKSEKDASDVTKMILAGSLGKTICDLANVDVIIYENVAKVLGSLQTQYFNQVQTAVQELIVEYEKAYLIFAIMGESNEVLVKIDNLDKIIKKLCEDYQQVLKESEQPNETKTPTDVDQKSYPKLNDKLHDILKKRLG